MDGSYTPEQQMIADSLAKLLASDCDFQKRCQRIANKVYFDADLWQQWSDLGLFAMPLAQEDGGFDATIDDMAVVVEVLGRFLALEPFMDHTLATCCLRTFAPQTIKDSLFPQVAMGKCRLVFVFPATGAVESGLPDNMANLSQTSDGQWQLDGILRLVYGGDVATDIIVLAQDLQGKLHACVLSADACDRQNYTMLDDTSACDIRLHQVKVDSKMMFAMPESALAFMIQRAVALLGVEALAIMQSLNEKTKSYLQQRQQFGQPLSKFQVLQHRMVEMKVQEELARSMVCSLLELSEDDRDCLMQVYQVKLKLNQCMQYVGEQAVQLHGGMGVSDELDIAHYFRRLTHLRHRFGDQAVCMGHLLSRAF